MELGAFAGGAAQANSEDITTRRASALELKMKSALAEQQGQITQETQRQAAQQEATKASVAQERGTLSGAGGADFARQANGEAATGQPMSPAEVALRTAAMPIIAAKQQQRETVVPVNDEFGIPKYFQPYNRRGVALPKEENPEWSSLHDQHQKLDQYTNVLVQAHDLFKDLKLKGYLGGLANAIPVGMGAAARDRLKGLANAVGPLAAQVNENVPGGRYSQLLGQSMATTGTHAGLAEGVEADLFGNGMLRVYDKYLSQGRVKYPPIMDTMFSMLPHEKIVDPLSGKETNGSLLIHPDDLLVKNNRVIQISTGKDLGAVGGTTPPVSDAGIKQLVDTAHQAITPQSTGLDRNAIMNNFKNLTNKKQ